MSYSNPMHHSTPGPWVIETRLTGGFDIDADYEGERERVAFAVNPSNSALIAAAPDLLAALDELLRVTVDAMLADGITLTDEQQAARDQALAAIARANPC